MEKTQLEDDLGISLDAPAIVPVAQAAVGVDRYVIIDTEGSGLFQFKDKSGASVPADAPGQPRMAELVMIYVGPAPDFLVEREYHVYIRPEGWEMQPGATAVNGLTDEFLRANGVSVLDALAEFVHAIGVERRVVVAFNAQHDLKQIRAELRRANLNDMFEQTRNICAMRASKDVMQVNKGYKLADACRYFGVTHEGAHTALGDTMACLEVFRKLWALGRLPEAAVHYAKNYNPGATP